MLATPRMSRLTTPRIAADTAGLWTLTTCTWLTWFALAGCATTRVVRPLGKPGESEVSMGAGGPLSTNYREANPPPIPMLTLGGRRAVSKGADVFADAHLGAAVFGVAWLDAGAAVALIDRESGPTLLVSSASHVLTNLTEVMFMQQVSAVASVRFGGFTPYLGWDTVLAIVPALDHLPIPFLGARCDLDHWFGQAEARWYAPFSDGRRASSNYLSPGGAGALGMSFSLGRRL